MAADVAFRSSMSNLRRKENDALTTRSEASILETLAGMKAIKEPGTQRPAHLAGVTPPLSASNSVVPDESTQHHISPGLAHHPFVSGLALLYTGIPRPQHFFEDRYRRAIKL